MQLAESQSPSTTESEQRNGAPHTMNSLEKTPLKRPHRIALVNIEPKIKNTAYMQISTYHKQHGDSVEWYSPLFHREYDRIYCSSLFTFTKKNMVTPNMICGGTGFNVKSHLPPEIEKCELDYSIYPNCITSYLWFSRGCFRQCPFCVVPTKEGSLQPCSPKNLNPNGKYISVMDNSPTANPKFYEAVEYLEKLDQPVDFQCGIDARIFTDKQGEALCRLRHWKQIRTAWDNPKDDLTQKLERMIQHFGKSRIMVYVLIGYWSTQDEDLMRVQHIRDLGLDAWVMPYNKQDPYQKAFERWANRHANCEWKDYQHGSWKP
jgi:hypothetical protein